jgi:hypothetical protein
VAAKIEFNPNTIFGAFSGALLYIIVSYPERILSMKNIQFPLAIFIPLVLLFSQYCFGQIDWVETESGTNANLNAVVYGDGLFVAVGDSGTVVTSEDGVTWEKQETGIAAQLVDIAYGNKMYVAVSKEGESIVSNNGKSWELGGYATTKWIESIAYGNDNFISVGAGTQGGAMISTNGIVWKDIEIDSIFGKAGIAYGMNTFITTGTDETINVSINGTDWESRDVILDMDGTYYRFEAVFFVNNHFIVTGYKYYWHSFDTPGYATFAAISNDCVAWDIILNTDEGDSKPIRAVSYGNGNYLFTRNTTIYTKSEKDDKFISRFSAANFLNSAVASTNSFVIVGNGGAVVVSEWTNEVGYASHLSGSGNSIRTSLRPGMLSINIAGAFNAGTPIDISIYDARGRTVISRDILTVSKDLNIPVPQLASGMYRLVIINDGNSYCTPLVVRQ